MGSSTWWHERRRVVRACRDVLSSAAVNSSFGPSPVWDEARFESLVANVPGAVYRCAATSDWDMEFMSKEIERICGYPATDFIDPGATRTYASVIHPDDREMVERGVFDALLRREPFYLEYRIVHANGDTKWVHERGRAVFDSAAKVLYLDGAIFDHTERKELEQQLEHLAYHDHLTGLPNRALFREHVELAIARARRGDYSAVVLFVDLDDFKLVNDCFGHDAGDELLCELADRLRRVARETDVVARQGGDEFLILLADTPSSSAIHAASPIAARVREVASAPVTVAGLDVSVTATVGIAAYPSDASSADELLKCADIALYQAKDAGRDTHRRYTDQGEARLAQLTLAGRLRQAVKNDEFVLHYQPVVELKRGRMVGAEALIRWNHPEDGLIPPGAFIDLAERTGLIEPITEWVIREASAQRAAWQHQGLDLCVSINLPARFWDPAAIRRMLATIDSFGLNPSQMMVEITESSAMAYPERHEALIGLLRSRGLRVAIDDFGTGHSSLARLKHLQVSTLKIDRSFIRDVPHEPQASTLVAAIIQLARTMGLTPLAEGIETEEQRLFLIEHGCPLGQGYHFSRPVPAAELPEYAFGPVGRNDFAGPLSEPTNGR
jgi:diguanylate cyclase (GGDEF)-like protein/PAS domain S-box-containing protein